MMHDEPYGFSKPCSPWWNKYKKRGPGYNEACQAYDATNGDYEELRRGATSVLLEEIRPIIAPL